MVITIYANRIKEAEKVLQNLSKKAEKCNMDFSYSFCNDRYESETLYARDTDSNGCVFLRMLRKVQVRVVDLIVSDVIIKNGDWKIIAMIEHGKVGNIVTTFDCKCDESWHKLSPNCDHCGYTRDRKVTFLVKNTNGEIKQVGKSCMKEYTGIDPVMSIGFTAIASMRILEDSYEFNESIKCSSFKPSVIDVLAASLQSIHKNGYVKSEEVESTKSDVIRILHYEDIEDKYVEEAEEVRAWLENQTNSYFDLLSNAAYLVLNNNYVDLSDIGRLCYIPVAYKNYLAKEEMKKKASNESTSKYVGNVGDRMTVKMISVEYVTSFETMYGTTHLYSFTDENGNKYVWFASSSKEMSNGCMVTFTVKNHSERDGVKQTVITRCKVA